MARKRKEGRLLPVGSWSKRLGTTSSRRLKTLKLKAQLRKLQESLQQDQPVTRAEMLVIIQMVKDHEERLSAVEAKVDRLNRMTENEESLSYTGSK